MPNCRLIDNRDCITKVTLALIGTITQLELVHFYPKVKRRQLIRLVTFHIVPADIKGLKNKLDNTIKLFLSKPTILNQNYFCLPDDCMNIIINTAVLKTCILKLETILQLINSILIP